MYETLATDILNISAASWDPLDSYGIIACELARHLTALGVYVNALQRDGVREYATQPADVRALTGRRAAEAIRRLYRWEDFAVAVLAIWNEVCSA